MRFLLLCFLCLPMVVLADDDGELYQDSQGVSIIRRLRKRFYTGLRSQPQATAGLGETYVTLADCENLPEEFDLRDLGVVPPIRNQGSCGSCWAFSQTASLESANAVATGRILNLAEQQLVSCDRASYGCGGGFLNGFNYQIKNGQAGESAFPYRASNVSCRSNLSPEARGTAFTYVGQRGRRPTEKEVMCALYKSRTIPWVTVSASGRWGNPPSSSSAVFSSCGRGRTNHAVGIVGWKTVNGKVYFKMRNSWGTNWGSNADRPNSERGYAMMQLGCDNLGEEVAYIITSEAMPCQPPKIKLPRDIGINLGDEVRISIRTEPGVTYSWTDGTTTLGTGDSIYVSPKVDTIYRITASNACGTAESSTRVVITTLSP